MLRSQGLRVVGVPVDDHGIVVEAIPARARLVYVTPSHQYPLGMVMARRRRLELLHWAARSGAAIVEDDYDSEFRHTARPLEPLQRLDRDGRVIYVGTFSKSLSPGPAGRLPRRAPHPPAGSVAPHARPSTGVRRRRPRTPSPTSSSTATWTSTCGGPGAATRNGTG